MLATFVGNFVRKIRRVEKRLVADGLDRKGHGQFFGLNAQIQTLFLDQLLDIMARIFALPDAVLARWNILVVGFMRRVQAFEEEQEPSNTAFEKGDANAREAIENPVIENIGAIDRESPRMTEGMHRHVHVHMIHAEAVM